MAMINILQAWLLSCQLLKPASLIILLRDAWELFIYSIKKMWPLLVILFIYSLSLYINKAPAQVSMAFSIPIKLLLVVLFIIVMRSHHTTYSLAQYCRDVWRSILWYLLLVGGVLLLLICGSLYSSTALWIANKCSLVSNETQIVTAIGTILQFIGLITGLFLSMGHQFILFSILDAKSIINEVWCSFKQGICLTTTHFPIILALVIPTLFITIFVGIGLHNIPADNKVLAGLRISFKYLRLIGSFYWISICFVLYQRNKDVVCPTDTSSTDELI